MVQRVVSGYRGIKRARGISRSLISEFPGCWARCVIGVLSVRLCGLGSAIESIQILVVFKM